MTIKVKKWSFGLSGTIRSWTPTTDVTTPTSEKFSGSVTITGVNNPRYKAQIAAGENAGTSLNVTGQTLQVFGGSNSATFKTSPTSKYSGDEIDCYLGLGPTYGSPSFDSKAQAAAVKSLYSKIRQAHQQFAGGVFLGEIKETVGLILHPASNLVKLSLQHVARTQHKLLRLKKKGYRAKQLTKAATDDYLTWVYGASPLMGDIEDLSKALQRILSDPPRTRIKAKGEYATFTSAVLGADELGSLYTDKAERLTSYSAVKYYGMFEEAKRDDGVLAQCQRVADLSGFNLRSFIPTVWELIPFSFVADYVVNIGDMLEAATTDTSSVKWLMRTETSTSVKERTYTPNFAKARANHPTYTYVAQSGSPGGWVTTSNVINRAAAAVPYLEPRLNLDNSQVKHLFNLAALLLNRRGAPLS